MEGRLAEAVEIMRTTLDAPLPPPAIAAQFHNLDAPPGSSAVLFDAENESGGELGNGIGAAADGGSVSVAGLPECNPTPVHDTRCATVRWFQYAMFHTFRRSAAARSPRPPPARPPSGPSRPSAAPS